MTTRAPSLIREAGASDVANQVQVVALVFGQMFERFSHWRVIIRINGEGTTDYLRRNKGSKNISVDSHPACRDKRSCCAGFLVFDFLPGSFIMVASVNDVGE